MPSRVCTPNIPEIEEKKVKSCDKIKERNKNAMLGEIQAKLH
jgi:hypothetical protein